jgi:pimeloyl-ACP methyl ester carboxylesterase
MTEKKRFQNIFSWIGKILLGLFVLLVGLIGIGLVREAILRDKYHAEYPAPGEMVTIDDHDIHLYCVGDGTPTVIFESDLDQYGSLSWNAVQGEIGKLTRACSYDRAGIMWSEPGPRPRDGETIAAELKTVLETAGEASPYILVGHAFGGAYLRIFAGQNPDDVYGMVLVESSHPDMFIRFKEYGIVPDIPDKNIRPLILLLAHLGMPGRSPGSQNAASSETDSQIQAFLPESSMAWFDEKVESPNTLAQAGQYDYLGDFPLIVIATARPPSIEQGQAIHDLWVELQQELLLLSKNSEIRIYEVGHYPQLQSPELVIEAIQDVLER